MLTAYRAHQLNTEPVITQDTADRTGTPVFIEGLTTYAPTRRLEVEFSVWWEVRSKVHASAATSWTVLAAPYRDPPEELAMLLGLPPDDPDDPDDDWVIFL